MPPRLLRRTRIAGSLTLAALLAATALPATAEPPRPTPLPERPTTKLVKSAQPGKAAARDRLGRHDRSLLAKAQQRGEKTVTIMMAVTPEETATVAAGVRRAGGTVAKADRRLGYVRADVPVGKVDQAAALRDVVAVDLKEVIAREPQESRTSSQSSTTAAAPGPQTPDANPYLPTQDTGSALFKRERPTWDGRGITIGILDDGIDLDHPALATTSTGERKIVDWVTSTDPLGDDDPTWLNMSTTYQGPTITVGGQTWTTPEDKLYGFQRFAEVRLNPALGGDVNRDGDRADVFGVLQDPSSGDVWVDADQDRVFAAAERIRPYKEAFQVGRFGVDNPTTAIRESVPFVIEYRTVNNRPYVNIGVVTGTHGTHVAGIAAGSKLFGGTMNGQAPGAKLVSSRACLGVGCTNFALLEGVIDLVRNRGVDVVNVSIGGLTALNDGNEARAELYDRLIAERGVQIFASAGNGGPGVNTVGGPALATDVVSVASSISKPTWQANYGSTVSSQMNLHTFSSRGPREDGGLKPNLAAPGSAVSTVPQWAGGDWIVESGYTLPPGYAHKEGTSMASPQAAGSAALVLSAAKNRGILVSPRALRDALYTGVVPLPGVSVAGQGMGLINTPLAWLVISQAKAGSDGIKRAPVGQDYEVDAPVCTPLSNFLRTPNRGPGLYNRCAPGAGGQVLNVASTYALTLRRTTGPTAAVKHNLKLLGDDAKVYTVPSSVMLGLNVPTTLNVSAIMKKQGLGAAILLVDDPATGVIDLRIPLTVIQAATPVASVASLSGSIQRGQHTSLFVDVPPGTPSLQVDLSGLAAGSQTRFIAVDPQGLPRDSTSNQVCYANFGNPASCNPAARGYRNPIPGIWEITVESRRSSPLLDNPFRLAASLQGVSVTPAEQTVAQAELGVPSPVGWTMTNTGATTTVTPRGGGLSSASAARRTISEGQSVQTPVNVPAGASSLVAQIGGVADQGADLDLSLFRCTPSCVLVGQSADGDSDESVTLANPEAGTYIVLVDGYRVPSGSTTYDYLDVFTSPALGSLAVTGSAQTLAAGASASFSGTLTPNARPGEGRELRGTMEVLNQQGGAVLGSGLVRVGSLQP